jgi:hypothetical protein
MADESVVDLGTGTTDAGLDTNTVDTTGPDNTGVYNTGVDNTQVQDEYSPLESLYADLDKEETDPNAALVDPNQAGTLPEEVTQALGLSEYVTEPAQLKGAVNAATVLWDVMEGKTKATGLLEGMRQHGGEEGFAKMIREDIIPYIEIITGMKLGKPGEVAVPDPMTTLQAKIAELERQPQLAAQKQAEQAQLSKATESTFTKLGELSKGTFFEGKEKSLGPDLLRQFQAMKLNPDSVMKEVLNGNTTNVEKAFKAIQKERTAAAAEYGKWMIAQKRRNASLPAGKGNPASKTSTDPSDMSSWSLERQAEYFRTGK